MIFGQDRGELRQMYIDAYDKACRNAPMTPLEAQIASVIEDHPEYHKALRPEVADSDFFSEARQSNPFLHMGLHLALRDQVKTDRPPGVRVEHARITANSSDSHDAEHRMIECLAETLWEAQDQGSPPDEQKYLQRLGQLAR